MNREIKFRGIGYQTGHFHYGSLILILNPEKKENTYDNAFIHNGVNISSPQRIHIKTIGQYVGVKDKNKKEIYEGDIVKWYQDHQGGVAVITMSGEQWLASVAETNGGDFYGYDGQIFNGKN